MRDRAAWLASLSPALRRRQLEMAAELDAPRDPERVTMSTPLPAPSEADAQIAREERRWADQRIQRRADSGE
jgi:hypothetical protein